MLHLTLSPRICRSVLACTCRRQSAGRCSGRRSRLLVGVYPSLGCGCVFADSHGVGAFEAVVTRR